MKVSKDYFLTHRDFIEYVAGSNNDDDIPMMHFSSKRCEVFSKKITISHEVDQEITIKESEATRILKEEIVSQTTVDNIMQRLFGDSNEQ